MGMVESPKVEDLDPVRPLAAEGAGFVSRFSGLQYERLGREGPDRARSFVETVIWFDQDAEAIGDSQHCAGLVGRDRVHGICRRISFARCVGDCRGLLPVKK